MENPESSAAKSIWTVEKGSEEEVWAAHDRLRPDYGEGKLFMTAMMDYHKDNQGSASHEQALGHDVACGSGKMAQQLFKKLTSKFVRVIATDSDKTCVDVLRARYTGPARDIEYVCCKAEGLADVYDARSAEIITAAQCMPVLDAEAALSSFARVLRPGGTLAISFYGRPHFTEEAYSNACQPLFDDIVVSALLKWMREADYTLNEKLNLVAYTLGSWLDNVDLSSPQWSKVQRFKWNSESAVMGLPSAAIGCPAEVLDRVSGTEPENVTKLEEPEHWRRLWTSESLRAYVYSCFPDAQAMIEADGEITEKLKALESAMGGAGAERVATWPVALVLATRTEE